MADSSPINLEKIELNLQQQGWRKCRDRALSPYFDIFVSPIQSTRGYLLRASDYYEETGVTRSCILLDPVELGTDGVWLRPNARPISCASTESALRYFNSVARRSAA